MTITGHHLHLLFVTFNDAAAEAYIILIKNHGLSWSDCSLQLIEYDAIAVRGRMNFTILISLPVAGFRAAAKRQCCRRVVDPVDGRDKQLVTEQACVIGALRD